MDILSAVLFGIIQGAAEYLPVSSSAHLALCHSLLGLITPDCYPGFDVLLHLGTLAAVFIVYGKDLCGIAKGLFTAPKKLLKNRFRLDALENSERLAVFAVVATLPTVAAALLGMDDLSDTLALYPAAVGALLIINGVMLIIADLCKKQTVTAETVKYGHAAGMGLFQALATVPGISRSGATVTGGMLCGIKRQDAVKLSFIMSVPAILGACVLKAPELIRAQPDMQTLLVYGAGCAAAAVFGMFAIKLLVFVSGNSKFRYFSYYCFAIGAYAVFRGLNG